MNEGSHRRPREPAPKWPLAVVAGILVLSLISTLVWWVRGRESAPAPVPSGSPTATAAPVQSTLLLQVSDDDLVAVNNALLSTFDVGGSSASVGVQPGLVVTPRGGPQTTFGRTSSLTGSSPSQEALSDILGVGVDGTWILGRLAFAGLVDAVGGVQVDVKTQILVKNPSGTVRFSLSTGVQHLDGPQATFYVQTLLPGEVEAQRMARFQEVFRQIEVRLPPDKLKVQSLLGSLGALSRSTIPADQLASFLLSLREDINLERLTTRNLPVGPAGLPGIDAVRLDFVAAQALVTSLFAPSLLVIGPNTPARVLVEDGVGLPGLGAVARDQLTTAGLVPLAGGSADRTGYTESLVMVWPDLAGSSTAGAAAAKALGLPASAVRSMSTGRTTADVVVVLGADYRPLTSPSPEPSVS